MNKIFLNSILKMKMRINCFSLRLDLYFLEIKLVIMEINKNKTKEFVVFGLVGFAFHSNAFCFGYNFVLFCWHWIS